MDFRTKQYLKKRFKDYYQSLELKLPQEFKKREWGFIFFDNYPNIVMRRHWSFVSEIEAKEYIQNMAPAHIYYSTAYYKYPNASNMKQKEWMGADLIFDLDADHLSENIESYNELFSIVKKETFKLLDFLIDDFGFSEKNIQIVFSGGRGYHVHVRDQRVLSLGSSERKEIVDYINANGLKTKYLFTKKDDEVFGWDKRIGEYLINFFKNIPEKNESELFDELTELIKKHSLKKCNIKDIQEDTINAIIQKKKQNNKIGLETLSKETQIPKDKVKEILIVKGLWDSNFKKDAKRKLNKIKEIAKSPNTYKMIKKGNIDFIEISEILKMIVEQAIENNKVFLGAAHTDEPVTTDIKRLIRMPLSLHGGTGMKVCPISISELEKFEPLNDAIVFGKREISIKVNSDIKPINSLIEMKGKTFKIKEGFQTVPEYLAIFLMCRGAARYG